MRASKTLWLGIAVWASLQLVASAAGRIEMELAGDPKSLGIGAQQWFRVLTDLKVAGLRIRAARPDDEAGIAVQGTEAQPVYKVTGMITERNELHLPGGRFTLRDQSALAAWLKKLREEGPPGSARSRLPFGLKEAELRLLNASLRPPVEMSTKGASRGEALSVIRRQVSLPMVSEAGVDAALAAAGPIEEEMKGLSSGTALAAILRPAGLALMPRKGRQGIELTIGRPAAEVDLWPVGLSAENNRQRVLPALFESINVEIDENPLADVLTAIVGRLEVPLLVDHNALATERTDLAEVKVSLPAKKLSYSLILRKLLGQARLVGELRTDEAGKPFLWVTTFRRSSSEAR